MLWKARGARLKPLEEAVSVLMVIWQGSTLRTSNCAALSPKNAHAAETPGKWETWSTWDRVPADDECLSAPWREECREREEGGGGGGGGGGRGKVEMERGESMRHEEGGWGGVTSDHVNPPQVHTKAEHSQRCRLRPPAATGHHTGNWPQTRVADFISTDNESCTSSCSLLMATKHIYVYILCFPIQCATQQRNSDGTTKNLQHERYGTMSLFSCCPPPSVQDCALEVTLPPETRTLSPTTDHTGTLSIPLLDASIIRCIHRFFFFFLWNRHAKLIYCLFVQSEKASRLSFLSGEFSARQSLKLNFTRSSSFLLFFPT